MKKVFLFAFGFLFLFSACKKDYTCTCTERYNFFGEVESYRYELSIEEASKKQAKYACNEATIKASEGGYNYEQTCELKK